MAENTEYTPLPADLPEDWTVGQTVAPAGADVGLSEQHGYNYLNAQVNAAQRAANQLQEEKASKEEVEAIHALPAGGTAGQLLAKTGQDRAGLFVTLQGDKIRLAAPNDDYILGIVSAAPSVVGDVYDDQWAGMFLTDIFGRPVYEDVDLPAELGPDGEVILPERTEHRQKLNPAYDHTVKYLPRTQRPEWDAVGLLGKLVAVDDGTCIPDGWCTVGEGGRATASETRTKYRVMARLDENHIRVMIL